MVAKNSTREQASRPDPVRTLEHAARHLEDAQAERPAGQNLVQPRENRAIASALDLLYERAHQLRREQPARLRRAAGALRESATALARTFGLFPKPGRSGTRWVICPEWGMRAAVGVSQERDEAGGGVRVIDITTCSLFPNAVLQCHKQCLRQL